MAKVEPMIIPVEIPFEKYEKFYHKDPQTKIVHLSKKEAMLLDSIIGGPEINYDRKEGPEIRDYRRLSDVLENPDFRKLFSDIYLDLKHNEKLRPSLHEMYEVSKKPKQKFHEMPGDKDPLIEDIAEEGINEDTQVALLPTDFIIFWCVLRGYVAVNPRTGFISFFLGRVVRSIGRGISGVVRTVTAPVRGAFNLVGKAFGKKNLGDEVMRIGGTIAGAYFGGPMGAALGSSLAHMGTGNSFEHSMVHGLKSYGMASAARSLAGAAGVGLPGAMGVQAGAPIVYGGKAAAEHAARQAAAGAAGNAAANTAANTAAQAAPSFIDKLSAMPGKALDFLTTGPGIAMAAAVPLLMSGHKKHKRDIEKDNAENRALWENEKEKLGVNAKLRDPINKYDDLNTGDISGKSTGKYIDSSYGYKKGGKVKKAVKPIDIVSVSVAHEGSGKGQADNINFDPPANGYYWDASTTSMLGDGNTSAGMKILKNFEKTILKNYKGPKINKIIDKVPAAVSDGEFLQSPLTVTLIGGGSNQKGAKILDKVRANIRRHKSMNGGRLPPKAKPLSAYFPKKMKG